MRKKDKKKKNQIKTYGILTIVVIILCFSLFLSLKSLQKQNNGYKIEDRVEDIEKAKEKAKEKGTIDYDVIGWLRVEGTNIDLPIVGYKETTTDYSKELENYAWNFDSTEKYHNKINIMGHNIMNLSKHPLLHKDYFQRFDDLMSFIYYDFAKENQYIQYTVDGKNYLYKIYAVGFEYAYKVETYENKELTEEEKKELIDQYKKDSLYQYDIDVTEKDDLISLMTCTRMFDDGNTRDFIVNARRVREKEETTKYKVEETKKYQEIKKMLEEEDYENEDA